MCAPTPGYLSTSTGRDFATNRIENITMKTEDLISIDDGSIPTNEHECQQRVFTLPPNILHNPVTPFFLLYLLNDYKVEPPNDS